MKGKVRSLALPSGITVVIWTPDDLLNCPARDLRLIHGILCLIEAHEKETP